MGHSGTNLFDVWPKHNKLKQNLRNVFYLGLILVFKSPKKNCAIWSILYGFLSIFFPSYRPKFARISPILLTCGKNPEDHAVPCSVRFHSTMWLLQQHTYYQYHRTLRLTIIILYEKIQWAVANCLLNQEDLWYKCKNTSEWPDVSTLAVSHNLVSKIKQNKKLLLAVNGSTFLMASLTRLVWRLLLHSLCKRRMVTNRILWSESHEDHVL